LRDYVIVLLILSALVLREAWLLIPESTATFDAYPFHDMRVTRQTYFYFAFQYGAMLIFIFVFVHLVNDYKEFFHIWFVLQLIELIDYFLTYNTAWFKVGDISVGITLIKLVTLTLTILFGWIYSQRSPR
jgi:hypothetical protein